MCMQEVVKDTPEICCRLYQQVQCKNKVMYGGYCPYVLKNNY